MRRTQGGEIGVFAVDVRHQNSQRIGIVFGQVMAQYASDGFRHVVNRLSLHLRPNVLNEGVRVKVGIDLLKFSSGDQTILCQVEKCASFFHNYLNLQSPQPGQVRMRSLN